MNHKPITGIFALNDLVYITDGEYKDKTGYVIRLGTAGETIYYHVAVQGVQTPITYMQKQLKIAS